MRAALVLVLVLSTVGPSAALPASAGSLAEGPSLAAVYPNPVVPDDRGEFVVLDVPEDLRGNLSVTDGETAVALPPGHPTGRLAVATDPVARNLTDGPMVIVAGRLRLANSGETVTLRVDGRAVDSVAYPRAPEGSIYRRIGDAWGWRRLGETSFPVRRFDDATATLFVLPDAPAAALEPLRSVERRLLLAAYTLTSTAVTDALCAAHGRGVDVRALVELHPVGGMTATGAERLDRLVDCGVRVRAIGGLGARYSFHHAKYAVADDRAVVLTENWKPSGVGGRSSRGWGVVVDDPAAADALAETFAADAGWRDSRPWRAARAGETFDRREPPANGTFPAAVTPSMTRGVGVEVIVAPENAERRVLELLDGAERSVRVIQVSVGGPSQPFVSALVRAARRGVRVKLLLADAWYVREHNRAVADALNGLARGADLPIRVRLATPRGRYGKIHAKGAVVDDEHVLVGSLNWNNASARRNREVGLVLHGERVGAYYAATFDADWQGGRWRLPLGLPAVTALLGVAGAAFARRSIEFEDPSERGMSPGGPEDDPGRVP